MNYRIGATEYTPAGYYRREEKLRRSYKLTVAQYNEMFDAQGGVCACCGDPEYKKQLAVDHCHTTNKVRALLCHQCNNNLGIYEKWGSMFSAYLEKYGEQDI
jgi:hypothetical protein